MNNLAFYTEYTIGGSWGKEDPDNGLQKVSIIRGTDFSKLQNGNYSTVPQRYETAKKIQPRKLEVGDLLIEISGGSAASKQRTGRCLYVTEEILNNLGNCIPASFCRLWRVNTKYINPKYLYYQIYAMHLSDEIALYENQSTGISNFQFKTFLDNVDLKINELNKQNHIVSVLETLDKKILTNLKINQTLEQMAQTVFKSWFVDFDPVRSKAAARAAGADGRQVLLAAMQALSGESPAKLAEWQHTQPELYRQLEQLAQAFPDELEEIEGFGEVPKGWKKVSIANKNILDIIKPKIQKFDGEKDYIATANVSGNSVIGNLEKITYESRPSRANMQPITGSIWFAKMVGEHKAILIDKEDDFLLNQTILSTGFMGLNPRENKKSFIYSYINSQYFEQAKNSLATGAVQIALNNGSFSSIEIILPNDEILTLFENKVGLLYSKISANQRANQSLAKIRDALLPKLLNGEIELCTNQ
ncbi:restriction endonuclease subunit S [Neisseria yangbaofengii]|uniref:restriction endonuclease subunit S n=1 Tax=Neisseria yangbaofengii TaxID=2709396 RepID=UPI0013ECC409|nr:restriction endonuclease subunit S [Neisseria yangbaofengii]